MGVFLVGSLSISRVLSWTIIYLVFPLPKKSSGYRPANGSFLIADLLAADRVYLLRMSPYVAVSFYLTLFTLTSQ